MLMLLLLVYLFHFFAAVGCVVCSVVSVGRLIFSSNSPDVDCFCRPHARRLLRHGYSVFVVPGGATEALYASPHADELQLSNRRGFVRLALSTGARLVPVFSFGETDTFRQWAVADRSPTIARFTAAFQRVFGVSLPLLTSPVPRRVPITTVVGAPVELVPPLQPGHPTDEEVACSLARYTVALTELYETHKHRYNCDPAKRLIIR